MNEDTRSITRLSTRLDTTPYTIYNQGIPDKGN